MKVYEIISEKSRANEGLADTLVKGTLGAAGKGIDAARGAYQTWRAGKEAAKAAKAASSAEKTAAGTAKAGAAAKTALDGASYVKKTFGDKILTLVNMLGIAYYVYDYWTTILPLEKDFEEFKEAFKKKTEVPSGNRFRGMTIEQAQAEADGEREKALGKAVAGALLTGGLIGKFVSGIGTFFSCFGVFGTLIGLPFRGVGFLIQAFGSKASPGMSAGVKAGLIYWLEKTESGQAVMKNAITAIILGGIGSVAAIALDGIVKGLDEFLKWINESEWGKKLGLNLSVPDAAKSKITPKPGEEEEREKEIAANTINGVPAITSDGYLRADRSFWINPRVKNEIDRLLAKGQPNPLNSIKMNPKLSYPTDLFRDMSFTPS